MLGDRLVRRRSKRKAADAFLEELATLSPGDLVVHADHGIGRYEGLTQIPVSKVPHDCVALEYARRQQALRAGREYRAPARATAPRARASTLDRLGGEAWQRAQVADEGAHPRDRRRADQDRRAARDCARRRSPSRTRAIRIRRPLPLRGNRRSGPRDRRRARRPRGGQADGPAGRAATSASARPRSRCAPPSSWRCRASRSRWSARPPCSPASITRTSSSASQGFPINVGRLSRLVPAGRGEEDQGGPRRRHRSTSSSAPTRCSRKSVEFKRLGLVIVDEEQHFGVAHKERLKALRADVHVLTLTATPIPRTLQMAMSGLRELSVIQTPPVDRLAVRTYVTPVGPGRGPRGAAARALSRRAELLRRAAHRRPARHRGMAPREQVPEVKVVTAHGQMAPTEVEERMSAFYDRKYDVLLSTTIVESGLDIPSANTLIVYRADRFGLAQLYQLRGRVGRSKTRAYAYLTTPADRPITEAAREAPAGARRSRQPRRRLPARQPRSRHPRRRQSARRRAVGPHQGGRLRTLPVDARGRDRRAEGRRRSPKTRGVHRRRSASTRRS